MKLIYPDGTVKKSVKIPANFTGTVEYNEGYNSYHVNGYMHRDGGLPAFDGKDGSQEYWVKGKRHRDGGLPAIVWAGGSKGYWVNGEYTGQFESYNDEIIQI